MKKQKIKYSIYITTLLTFFFLVISISLADAKTYYTWVDEKGVTHITEFKDEIPKNRLRTVKTFESKGRFDFLTTGYYYVKSNIHKFLKYIVFILIGIVALFILRKVLKSIRLRKNQESLEKRNREIEDSRISSLSSYQLKLKVSEVLENMGYKLSTPNAQFEGLIDYIGFRDGEKVAICLHESENLVSKNVVSEIDRERHKHSCNKSMIICRTYFEEDVTEFAKQIDCELIDKEKLSNLLLNV